MLSCESYTCIISSTSIIAFSRRHAAQQKPARQPSLRAASDSFSKRTFRRLCDATAASAVHSRVQPYRDRSRATGRRTAARLARLPGVASCSPADPWDCTAPAGHGGFKPKTPASPGSGRLAVATAWPGVQPAYRPGECTAKTARRSGQFFATYI